MRNGATMLMAVLVVLAGVGGRSTAGNADFDPAFTGRAFAGPGASDLGVSGFVAVECVGWINRSVGLGVRVAKGGDSAILWGPYRDRAEGEARISFLQSLGGDWSMYFGAGVGFADVVRGRTELCLFGGCTPRPPVETNEPTGSFSLGWLWHPEQFLLSFGLHAQVLAGGGGSVVMPIGIGFSVPRGAAAK